MSLHSTLDHRGVEFEVAGDREGFELVNQRVIDPAQAVAWAIEGASDAELAACASAIVDEQSARSINLLAPRVPARARTADHGGADLENTPGQGPAASKGEDHGK